MPRNILEAGTKPFSKFINFLLCFRCILIIDLYDSDELHFSVVTVPWASGAVRSTIVQPPAPSWEDPTSPPMTTRATPSMENAPLYFPR